MSNLPYTFFGGHDRQTFFVSVEVAAQMVTSTSSENLFYRRYEFQNQNFDFETTKTTKTCLVDFFQGGSPNKIME